MKRKDMRPVASDLIEEWPSVERVERWQRVWDWVVPIVVVAVIAFITVYGEGVITRVLALLLAGLVGALMDQARWRRRSFRGMKESKEKLQLSIAFLEFEEADDDA